MENPSEQVSAAAAEEAAHSRLVPQLRMLLRALYASPIGRPLVLLVSAIFAVVVATAYGQIRINRWNKPFFDALSRRDLHEFLVQLGVFLLIAGVLLVLNVAQRWLIETLKLRLREGLVQDLVGHWMMPRRAFWLAHAGAMGVNPDQRMHDDAHKLCDLSADLGVGLFQASILLASFASVLWVISNDFVFRFGGADYAVPGFMLWVALIYAAVGSLLSYGVGRSLIGRNAERYAREADLRFSLVHVNEHLDGISLAAGEADERRRIEHTLAEVLVATRSLVRGLTHLTWVTAGFGWTTIVAPILVASPLYLSGKISFGGLMMAAAAFTQAQSSLRWFVDNFSVIADWRATLLRVAGFRQALTTELVSNPVAGEIGDCIDYAEGEPGRLLIDALEIQSDAGRDRLAETNVVVQAGERVLIAAAPGTSKTLLFRTLAGLWRRGGGRVTRPLNEAIIYLPRGTPYLPRGSLREILAYPLKVEGFDPPALAHALIRLGLERLVTLLDVSRRWDRDLNHDEQLRLAFARIVLQAPPWVLIDETLGALDDDTLERVIDVFTHELRRTGVIHIGRLAPACEPLFPRVLHLVRAPGESGIEAEHARLAGAGNEPARRPMAEP